VQRTAVVTDSTARPVGPGVTAVVDLDVVVDGLAVREADVDLADLLARMSAGAEVGTSRPSPDGFARAYEAAAEAGASAVVSVHLSGGLSGTVEAARLAAASAPLRVEVVDTGAVGAVLSAAVDAAAGLARAGADRVRVAAAARRVAEASRTWVSPATAAHLRRGGRAADGATSAPELLSARPLLVVEGGRLVPLERVRTTGRLVDRLTRAAVDHLGERPHGGAGRGEVAVVVQHAGASEAAERLEAAVRAAGLTVRVVALSPVLAAHVGPGALGLAVVVRPDERA
jgi:DegV family protein with EDD domain